MIAVDVLLSGRLKLNGYGNGYQKNRDGTFHLALNEGAIVPDVIQRMGVPPAEVTMTMVNGHICRNGTALNPGDRVVLIPSDVAALWRHLGTMNMGQQGPLEF
ncbi:MAG TPA: MoaD/ThiS family protein [Chloroflexota bacterium]|nr:MoaD/ThiS family protein [Chloroflexota bacterium]